MSKGNTREAHHKDAALLIQAYADLIEDCAEHPEWQSKFQAELGSNVAYLVGMAERAARKEVDQGDGAAQAAFKRYDAEKQRQFK